MHVSFLADTSRFELEYISDTSQLSTVTCSSEHLHIELIYYNKRATMYLLCFTLLATSFLTECASQVTQCGSREIDLSLPVSAEDYKCILKQRFATNYFNTQIPTAFKYQTQNIQNIYDRGFRNVRLRCQPSLYNDMYNSADFSFFLTKLTEVVDECIRVGVAPIIAWGHHSAEAYATEQDRRNFIDWWTRVAETLKDRNYHLSYNLFTELGVDICRKNKSDDCTGSLRRNKEKYHNWTAEAVSAICATGAKNAQ